MFQTLYYFSKILHDNSPEKKDDYAFHNPFFLQKNLHLNKKK